MAATAAQVSQLRRMIDEPATTTYSDDTLQAYIERHPTLDENGQEPGDWLLASPPRWVVNTLWIPTYDLAAAAADLWAEKASALAPDYDFNADGGSFSRSQAYEQAMKQARYYRSCQTVGTIDLTVWPRSALTPEVIINLPEPD